jgi:hypothetical protein
MRPENGEKIGGFEKGAGRGRVVEDLAEDRRLGSFSKGEQRFWRLRKRNS